MTNEELFSRLLERIDRFDYIHDDEIPDIDLYMDQVTSFMDSKLGHTRRRMEDKVLTKTMINNYTKNDLLPPPVGKKYSKNHILQLIYIYYMKSFLSIGDIQAILEPLDEAFWQMGSSPSFSEIYRTVFSRSRQETERIKADLEEKFRLSQELAGCEDPDKKALLARFIFIWMANYDIYIRKQFITSMIDSMAAERAEKNEKKSEKKKGR